MTYTDASGDHNTMSATVTATGHMTVPSDNAVQNKLISTKNYFKYYTMCGLI